ncbi:MAG: FlgD immunoglobulin-like domain containing protein, partial [bacterium]
NPAPPNFATRTRINVDLVKYGDLDGDGISDNNGISDIIPDNFGYISGILGRDPLTYYATPVGDPVYSKTAGLRSDGPAGNLSNITGNLYQTANCKPAIIAPFWGPLQMSQYNKETKQKEDYGKCYFKRTITGDSLIIAYYNMTFEGTATCVYYSVSFAKDARSNNMQYYFEWDAKVVLDRRDSSVTYVFERLAGTGPGGLGPGDYLRSTTTCGVYGYARHINYDSKNPNMQIKKGTYNYPWAGEYAQYTHYFGKYTFSPYQYPYQGVALKFKQWKNTIRVANIGYRVRNTDPATLDNPSYEFTVLVPADDYELLAGEPLIGAIQPRCLIQNLTNEIQGRNGVNFTIQDFEFWARFRIRNLITDRIVYNRSVPVSQNCMELEGNWDSCYNGEPAIRVRLCNDVVADAKLKYKVNSVFSGPEFKLNKFTGVPPYRFVQIDFPPFEPSEFSDHQIGRLRAYVIAEPLDLRTMEPIGDQWPFDDTTSVRLFVMRRLSSFQDDVTQFHIDIESGMVIPSVLKWVTIEGVVKNGEDISQHPLPPRGQFTRHMPGEEKPNPKTTSFTSPVINLNRLMSIGSAEMDQNPKVKAMTEWGNTSSLRGDEIRSFPIDLRGKTGAMFAISVQRGSVVSINFLQDYLRNWGDDVHQGPEGKTFYNGSPFNAERVPGNGNTVGSLTADMLCVEFAKPSDDGVNGICNIPLASWRHNPSRRGSKQAVLTTMPFLTIYGSGGYLRGFLESDPDSALDYPNDTKFQYNSMRPDFYDDGIDWEFKRYFVQIPDTFINWKRDGAKNIRFRVRVYADDHMIPGSPPPKEPDDADNFYVDNVNILFPEEITDVEMSSVRLQWPYTVVPPSQATGIPIICKIANSTSKAAPTIAVKVKVYKDGDLALVPVMQKDPNNGPDFYSGRSVWKAKPGVKPIYCRTENVPNLKAGQELEVTMPSWNVRRHQTAALQKYTLVAYSIAPYQDMVRENDTTLYKVEINLDAFYGYEPVTGTALNNASFGLNLPGNSKPGDAITGKIDDEDRQGPGLVDEPHSGKIASKFQVFNTDTITGFYALLGSFNASPEYIEFAVYRGDDKAPSGEQVAGSYMLARRGQNGNNYTFNAYVPYFLPKPLELASGTYWVSITQLGLDPLCLGASASRTRMKIMNHYQSPENGAWGEKGINLYIDKNLRVLQNNNWVNDNYFAYLNELPKDETGKWVQFTPLIGNIAYPVTDHVGMTLSWAKFEPTYFNASWIPMLRPLFTSYSSNVKGQEKSVYEQCLDDVPVELVGFRGTVKEAGIELIWETATETNNYGFEVQRKLTNDQEWKQVAFVSGSGNSVTNRYYSFLDKQVKTGETYSYRLSQIDNDGTVSCSSSNILTITYDLIGNLELFQNNPNPFNANTTLSYYLPLDTDIKLDIIDMYGKVIKVLTDGTVKAGKTLVNWDGRDNEGNLMPSGTYIYRILAGNEVKTQKMTIVR